MKCHAMAVFESACKPGSVKSSHLSVAGDCSRAQATSSGRRGVRAQATSSGRRGVPVCPSTVLLRIEFTASACLHVTGELLPRLSTLTGKPAVYFCCTCPRVTPGGCYPLFLPLEPGLSSRTYFHIVPATAQRTTLVIVAPSLLKSTLISTAKFL